MEESRSGAWGAVIRDHDGRIILSAWDYIPRCNGADCAEAMACLEGLRKAMSGTDLPLIIETDCSSVTKALILSFIDRSEVGTIAKEFQAMKGNREVRVCKVDRRENRLAHSLAQLGRRELRGGVMQGTVPTCVLSEALHDCTNYFFST